LRIKVRTFFLENPDQPPAGFLPQVGLIQIQERNVTVLRNSVVDTSGARRQAFEEMTDERPLPPGELIKTELQLRGWTQADFALILGRHIPIINEILQGKRAITPELAVAIGTALSTRPEKWLELENKYRLSLLDSSNNEVRKKAQLFEFAPVKEMEKRGWILPTSTIEELESQLLSFFDLDSLEIEPDIQAVARQTVRAEEFTSAQRAWLKQAARLASILNVRPFQMESLKSGLSDIRLLMESPEKTRHVPKLLAELGVRFVVVEPLPKSRIDGAVFWLSEHAPVIVLSLRYDRIDAFWYTLAHELSHVVHGDKNSVDVNLVGESRIKSLNEMEERADKEAADFLIPHDSIQSFIIRIRPFYSKERITQFAHRMRVHPGIVTGQLQHLKEIDWKHNREMLAKVREIVTTTTITDGWGKSARQFLSTKG
jgi:HTH-type transcriptional regulator/antitoxin HigA